MLENLIEAQLPLNWRQMQRLGLSMKPIDSKGRFDERCNEYEFGNEALGILGMRAVKVDPEVGINYKITVSWVIRCSSCIKMYTFICTK